MKILLKKEEYFFENLSEVKNKVEEVELYALIKHIVTLDRSIWIKAWFLEALIKISELLYLKSRMLLKRRDDKEGNLDEKVVLEDLRVRGIEGFLRNRKLLWEDVFLPRIRNEFNNELSGSRGDITWLLGVLIEILEKEGVKEEVLPDVGRENIEHYIEEVRNRLFKEGGCNFYELIKGREILDIIYLFLAFLFLCFEGVCVIVQEREEGNLILVLREEFVKKRKVIKN
jgi:chromatin segregation and condensation protein Rec8/ScpA/Scc1 (kleisin family)